MIDRCFRKDETYLDKTMLGIVDETANNSSILDLSINRSIAAIPFAGRYRLIDFILSNMVNSGIFNVAVFPKFHYRSLMDHIGAGKPWDLNRKKDGLFFFPSSDIQDPYQEINSFQQYEKQLDYFLKSSQKYVLIAGSNIVCNMNLKEILRNHIESYCEITEVMHHNRPLGLYILEKTLLLDFLNTWEKTGYENIQDVVQHGYLPINRYHYYGYGAVIDSIESYYKHNLELIDPKNWKQLFIEDEPIYTKVKDEPPTKYTNHAYVKNSIIANGCIIEGHVENSIIFRAVKIGKGAIVRNSIIMQKSMLKTNSLVELAILDKNVRVEQNVEIRGTLEKPIVIQKGKIQGALMNS